MRRSVLAAVLLASLICSTTSHAEWKKVGTGAKGDTYYADTKIRKRGGYIYFWTLIDLLKPLRGHLSAKTYYEADCEKFRFRRLQAIGFKQPKGNGLASINESYSDDPWQYPRPGSPAETTLEGACATATMN